MEGDAVEMKGSCCSVSWATSGPTSGLTRAGAIVSPVGLDEAILGTGIQEGEERRAGGGGMIFPFRDYQ